MLNMVKSSVQTCLDKFFELSEQEDVRMSQQAFSEARQKVKWEAIKELFKAVVDKIYTGYYETWHGYRVSAIDGSKIQLPDEQSLRDFFGAMGKDSTAATAQASALYDIYNDVLIDAQIEPITTDERKLAEQHIDELCKLPSLGKELILFDRGYPSFELIEKLTGRKIHFLMRVKRKFNLDIDQLGEGDHTVTLRHKGHEDIVVRVIKFTLSSGEEETLITDLFDKRMGIKAFKELYFKRWPIETKYYEIKNKLEVENFSGRTEIAVRQDFFVSMFMSNVITVASWDAQKEVDACRDCKNNKYDYHVNRNQAIGTFKDRFIEALLASNPRVRSKKVVRILFLLTENAMPTRPERHVPRNPTPRKAKFRHNKKSNC